MRKIFYVNIYYNKNRTRRMRLIMDILSIIDALIELLTFGIIHTEFSMEYLNSKTKWLN
jgi:hypothetical protein